MNEELAERHALALGATLGPPGRLLPGLEERVRRRHHDHVCVFNANVCLRGGKLWWGDVDLTTPEQQLRELARLTGETACLLHERDGRFRPEDAPALERALHSVAAEGQTGWDEELSFRAWRRDLEAAMRRAAELRGDLLVELEREPDLSGRAPASRSRAQASASR